MAPLRSSRSTRNQDHQAAARSRGVVDLDPTEGLPVQKWEQVITKVNQDLSGDINAISSGNTGVSTTSSAEWSAQFNTSQYPWPELPLPSFFSQLPLLNQELLRRSRCPNTKPILSEWDRKNNQWISGADIERQQRALKDEHAKPSDTTNQNQDLPHPNGDNNEHEEDDDREEQGDDDMEMDHEEETGTATIAAPQTKRRRHLAPEERTFEVKRWVQVPFDVAEKTEERKFLADRRPGMPSLYGGTYQNQVFQHLGLSQSGYTAYGTSNASYDLGDGAGLSTAVTQDQPAAPPVRKNMPPKRKKKKGGPGRKKANPNPSDIAASTANGTNGQSTLAGSATEFADGSASNGQDVVMQDANEEGSESGDSEGEGSEEGEIEENLPGDVSMAIEPEMVAPTISVVEPPIVSEAALEPASETVPAPGSKTKEESIPSATEPESTLEPESVLEPTPTTEPHHEVEQPQLVIQSDPPITESEVSQTETTPQIAVPSPVPAPIPTAIPVNDLLAEPSTAPVDDHPEPKEEVEPPKESPETDLLGGLEDQVNKDLAG